jgi:hypothetical protein
MAKNVPQLWYTATRALSIVYGLFLLLYGGAAFFAGLSPGGALDFKMRLIGGGLFLTGLAYITSPKAILSHILSKLLYSSTLILYYLGLLFLTYGLSKNFSSIGAIVYASIFALSLSSPASVFFISRRHTLK